MAHDLPNRTLLAASTHELFRAATGQAPDCIAYAPGRVNLIGEHTDYSGGFVLPFAIDRGVCIAARRTNRHGARAWSTQQPGSVAEFELARPITAGPPPWSNYLRGVVAEFQSLGIAIPPFDAFVHADLPVGGGLSSSAALQLALAIALEALSGVSLSAEDKALCCHRAEQNFTGLPCGIMDQFAITFGRREHLVFLDCQSRAFRLVPLRDKSVSFLIVNTKVKHTLIDGAYAERRRQCEAAAQALGCATLRAATPALLHAAREQLPEVWWRRARHVITENERTLAAVQCVEQGDWLRLGQLMGASHESLRDYFEVSCAELDLAVHAAETSGALGCRMTGGGFGGCCIVLVETLLAASITESIRTIYSNAAQLVPEIFVTDMEDGAGLVGPV